ncbi:MAG: phosphatase PAP2 family protein [Candidatus Promineifilaceae bacterium]|nr:phosphatase PAP2 family protein [Candidatus Promineifilaceae bacterium]
MGEDQEFQAAQAETLSQRARQALRWLDLHEWVVVAILLVLVGGTVAFVSLSGEVSEGDEELARLDERLLLALREPDDRSDPLGSMLVESAVRDVTALGGLVVLSLLTLAVALFLWLAGDHRNALFVLVAIVGGMVFTYLLKELFARQRPDLVSAAVYVDSFSFPSGHAMTAAVTYLTLGTLLATSLKRSRLKIYILATAVLVTAAVGLSRVYLGVHWPTDVLGGWTAGTVWALLMWLAARWLRER